MNFSEPIAFDLGRVPLYKPAKQESGILPEVASMLGSRSFSGFQNAPAGIRMRAPSAAAKGSSAVLPSAATGNQDESVSAAEMKA